MRVLGNILVALVAILHIGFLVLEMFLWTTPFGLRTFNLTPEFAAASAALAANRASTMAFSRPASSGDWSHAKAHWRSRSSF